MSINRVVLIGRLTKECTLRYSPSGVAVTNFTIAVDRTFKNAQGEKETDFIPIVTFKALAELCANYLDKGKLCSVDGRIQTGSYNNKDGQKVFTTEVIAENVQFLSPKEPQDRNNATNSSKAGSFGHEVNLDDDIPF